MEQAIKFSGESFDAAWVRKHSLEQWLYDGSNLFFQRMHQPEREAALTEVFRLAGGAMPAPEGVDAPSEPIAEAPVEKPTRKSKPQRATSR